MLLNKQTKPDQLQYMIIMKHVGSVLIMYVSQPFCCFPTKMRPALDLYQSVTKPEEFLLTCGMSLEAWWYISTFRTIFNCCMGIFTDRDWEIGMRDWNLTGSDCVHGQCTQYESEHSLKF